MNIVSQTREEKIAMYEKLSKKELIELLLENQRLVDLLSQRQFPVIVNPQPVNPWWGTIPPHPLYPPIVCDTTTNIVNACGDVPFTYTA